VDSNGRKYIYSDERQIVVGSNNRMSGENVTKLTVRI
jgi:hypothetical protein